MCFDLGEENRRILRQNLKRFCSRVDVIDSLEHASPESFDYLLAFEVLEHIENDSAALRQWQEFLKPGGRILLSVPAHMRKFDMDDEAMGHHRRYEKQGIHGLLQANGFSQIDVANYGFPLGNFTRNANRFLSLLSRGWQTCRFRSPGDDQLPATRQTMTQRSMQSGISRSSAVHRWSFLFKESWLRPFTWIQRCFYTRDLGDGYVVTAIKS